MGKGGVYTVSEKMLLAKLAKQYITVIENKAMTASTNEAKKEVWRRIAEVYNSRPEITQRRRPDQLRKLWDNLKQKKRKSMSVVSDGSSAQPNDDPVLAMVIPSTSSIKSNNKKNKTNKTDNLPLSICDPLLDASDVKIESKEEVVSGEAEELHIEPEDVHAQISATFQEVAQPAVTIHEHQFNAAESFDVEARLRIQKLQEAIVQQRELHKVHLQVAKIELQHKKLKLELEKQIEMGKQTFSHGIFDY